VATRRDRNRRTPSQARQELVSLQAAHYSGPLPPASELAKYDAVVPGMAERLLTQFELQASHRMALERHLIHSDSTRANWGLAAAFVFGIVLLGAAVYWTVNGYQSVGIVAIVSEFVTYGGLFVYSSETRRRERKQQRQG
jgi:uncharacterized membrane protein